MTSPRSDRYRDTIRQFCVLLAVFAAFGTNVLANIQPIGGLTIGEISKTFFPDVLVVPANYAFIIWSVIYLGLFSLTIYQALPARRQDLELRTIGYGIVAASLAQIIWVYLFQLQQFALSVVAMLAIAVPLASIYRQAQIGCRPVSSQRLNMRSPFFPTGMAVAGGVILQHLLSRPPAIDPFSINPASIQCQ